MVSWTPCFVWGPPSFLGLDIEGAPALGVNVVCSPQPRLGSCPPELLTKHKKKQLLRRSSYEIPYEIAAAITPIEMIFTMQYGLVHDIARVSLESSWCPSMA